MTDMKSTRLVQRLNAPRGNHDNPFAFGGGLVNGGLSDEAMGLLRGIFSFDYMGAAEYEFGAVPKALNVMAKEKMVTTSFTIPLALVSPDYRDKSKKQVSGEVTIYVLAPEGFDAHEIQNRILGWAKGSEKDLKVGTHLSRTLRPFNEWDGEAQGWLELNNGFFFFTDREMWEKTATLFGVEVSEKV